MECEIKHICHISCILQSFPGNPTCMRRSYVIYSNNHCVTHKDIHKICITKHSFTYLFANLMKFPLMIYIKYQSTKYVTKAAVFHHIASFINMHIILSNFFK